VTIPFVRVEIERVLNLVEVIDAGDPCFDSVSQREAGGTGAELGVVGTAEEAAG
jgi:hypothetical protein